jgi:hypothetical protein
VLCDAEISAGRHVIVQRGDRLWEASGSHLRCMDSF